MIQFINIAGWVKRWSERLPKKDAILYEGERITYLDLYRRAGRTGCWLRSLGVEKGDRVTKFLGVPTVFRALLKVEPDKRRDLSSLEVVTIGGEKVPPELIAQCKSAGFPLRQVMGQTETSIFLWASEEDLIKKPGSVGRPVPYGDVAILDESGRPVNLGEVGQLVGGGAVLMKDYWRDSARSRETIKDGWLYAGDLAYMDEEGYFYLVDRAVDMYISGGENVYPAEVEKVLREHPGSRTWLWWVFRTRPGVRRGKHLLFPSRNRSSGQKT